MFATGANASKASRIPSLVRGPLPPSNRTIAPCARWPRSSPSTGRSLFWCFWNSCLLFSHACFAMTIKALPSNIKPLLSPDSTALLASSAAENSTKQYPLLLRTTCCGSCCPVSDTRDSVTAILGILTYRIFPHTPNAFSTSSTCVVSPIPSTYTVRFALSSISGNSFILLTHSPSSLTASSLLPRAPSLITSTSPSVAADSFLKVLRTSKATHPSAFFFLSCCRNPSARKLLSPK
mmetsp:Transcript_20513/g.51339  ORF Transcript_20513/g.51339 Transcript_20513/m.51339 type:complete len:236 (-) Transcript_20513:187-894(-)